MQDSLTLVSKVTLAFINLNWQSHLGMLLVLNDNTYLIYRQYSDGGQIRCVLSSPLGTEGIFQGLADFRLKTASPHDATAKELLD